MGKRLTTEEFIIRAKGVHVDRYDYSEVEYIGNKVKIKIICKIHGVFEQTPNDHLNKNGCQKCGGSFMDTEYFKELASIKHNNKFDYSKSEYVNGKTKVIIICHEKDEDGVEHGEFLQTYSCHLSGDGCSRCSGSEKTTRESFIKKSIKKHGLKYNYDKVDFVNYRTKVLITCPEHGDFYQTPMDHIAGCGCSVCSGAKLNKDIFVDRSNIKHEYKYDYSKVEYINTKTKVVILCKEHGEFSQCPEDHMKGTGCPKCNGMYRTTDEFIFESNIVHSYKYLYNNTNYISSDNKVVITCLEHGDFEQLPSSHLSGTGCPLCSKNSFMGTDGFIKKANEKHNFKYVYNKVDYTGSMNKVIITCLDHGDFEMAANTHLCGFGCHICSGFKINTDIFIERANIKHNYKYDYSKVKYINSKENVLISCTVHGEFYQNPNSHLDGRGCPRCSGRNKTTEDFILEVNEIHDFKYDYSLTNYVDSVTKLKIICPEHGEFEQTPAQHLAGVSCPICTNKKLNTEEFIRRGNLVHHGKYNYSLVEYTTIRNKVKIICPDHGVFEQRASAHIGNQKQGCPNCRESRGEVDTCVLLNNNNIKFVRQHSFPDCVNILRLSFDFYLENINTCIEINGEQHYFPVEFLGGEIAFAKQLKRDKIKKKYCENNNIKLLIIKYDEDIEEKLKEYGII